MPEMLAPTSAIVGRGLSDKVGLITDGRFSGGSWGLLVGHAIPEAFEGGTPAPARCRAEEIERRRRNRQQPKLRYTRGVLAKFAALASPASKGAVTGQDNQFGGF